METEDLKAKLVRRAIGLEIGGFRPPDSLDGNWFGKVSLCAPGEVWPRSGGKFMHALCQLNIDSLPFRPPGLEGVGLITVFIGPDELPIDASNGTNWCLRAYPSDAALETLEQVETGSQIKSLPMRTVVINEDYPMWEDVIVDLPDRIAEDYYDHFHNVRGLKLGGWPSLVRSEIYWAPWNKHPAQPRYVFQIDSTEKGNWMWGDGGVGYFGRGTKPGAEQDWACQWQCY